MPDPTRFPLDSIPISALRIFAAVVESQGFSAAARQMKISASMTSKAVAVLEKATGEALLLRTTRKVSVTEAGKRFYDHCITILDEVDSASKTTSEELKGRLRVSAPPSVSSEILGPGIKSFLETNPLLTLDLFVTSSMPDIIRNRIDVALVLREWPEVKMANRLVARLDRVLVASPEYVSKRGMPKSISDLQEHNCLASLLSGSQEPWILTEEKKKRTVRVNAVMSSDNGDTLRLACLNGLGIANLYAFHAKNHLESGELVRVMPDVSQDSVGLYAFLPHREMVRSPANAFIEHLEKLVAGTSPETSPAV